MHISNYTLKNQSRVFWLSSIAIMKRAAWPWRALLWEEWSQLAFVCRQFRRTRIVAMIKGCTASANWYWSRLELLGSCRGSCSVMGRILWHHDVRMSGKCAVVLERVGEFHDVGHVDGSLTVYYPLP